MSFLDEIREQPRYIRETMFGLCVVITVSIVGIIWFRSFEKNLFVALNPQPEKQEEFYAKRADREPTLFAVFTTAFGNMQAAFYNALGLFEEESGGAGPKEYIGGGRKLPISGDRLAD